jgi:hypothetical protein
VDGGCDDAVRVERGTGADARRVRLSTSEAHSDIYGYAPTAAAVTREGEGGIGFEARRRHAV